MSKERRNHTLQTTALLNEAFLRLVHAPKGGWNDRNHFMAVASRVMRQVLVDYARARGPEPAAVNVEIEELESRPVSSSVLDIDHALQELAVIAPRQVELVELRFFGGLTLEEAATALGVSPRTADKDWALARAWLRRRLAAGFTEETPQ